MDILQLDPNFAAPQVQDDVAWYDIRGLDVEGQGWPAESDPFCRLPNRAQALVPEKAWTLSRKSAGVCVRFVTDSTTIAARWKLRFPNLAMSHMAASGASGVDLYVHFEGRWRWLAVGRPAEFPVNQMALHVGELRPGTRLYTLYLPLYNGVESVELGLAPHANLRKAPPRTHKPICFYGTSIVQGGVASRPGANHVATLGRWLDRSVINLGFSGNGKAEIEMAHLLAELDPCVYVIDPLPNMEPEQVTERIEPLVRTLRQARPKTPIVLVENLDYRNTFLVIATHAKCTGRNAALKAAWQRLQTAKVPGLHYVPSDGLLGDDGEGTVDGTHPTDLGFLRFARGLEPVLRPLI